MTPEEDIALDCPYCQVPIRRPLSWFRQTYTSCPECGGGLAAGQFEPLLAEIEQAFDASIEEMIFGDPGPAEGCSAGRCAHGCCTPPDEP